MMYHQSLFIVSITHKYTMYIIIESFIVSIPHMYTMYIQTLLLSLLVISIRCIIQVFLLSL